MATVLQDVTDEQLTRHDVERRVEDWGDRVEGLYGCVESWLPEGWSARRGAPVTMNEPLMREFGVAPRQLPTLKLLSGSRVSGTFEPRALWVVGTNGRLDLIDGDKHYLIVDMAENFQPPKWRVAELRGRAKHLPFDRDWLRNAISG